MTDAFRKTGETEVLNADRSMDPSRAAFYGLNSVFGRVSIPNRVKISRAAFKVRVGKAKDFSLKITRNRVDRTKNRANLGGRMSIRAQTAPDTATLTSF